MSEANLVYFITGANRGIGRHVVSELLLRPATTVLAAVRDVESETATSLLSLQCTEGSILHVVPLNEKDPSINAAALPQRLQDLGISHIDVLISNAGSSSAFRSVLEARVDEGLADFESNALAPMRLFQACWPFLQASDGSDPRKKKFLFVSSTTGSIGVQYEEHFPTTSYGMSKAAANWLAVSISLEHKKDGLKTGIYHPGFVNTAMGQQLASSLGMTTEPPTSVEESGKALLRYVDELSLESSGKFGRIGGGALPW